MTGIGSSASFFLFVLLANLSCCANSFISVGATPTRDGTRNFNARSRPVSWRESVVVEAASKDDTAKLKTTKKKKTKKKDQDYEHRRQLWLERYGSVEALQSTFGTGNALTPSQTRRLYHTLLPRSLLGLVEMGLMKPDELAPLAYEARIAAKLYARSRTVWYSNLFTNCVDQYRNLRKRGRLSSNKSLTWEEIWSKYEAQIVQEECEAELSNSASISNSKNQTADSRRRSLKHNHKQSKKLKEKDLTMRIYLRILERSCVTNEAFDRMFLKQKQKHAKADDQLDNQLSQIATQLDQDVRDILLRPQDIAKAIKREQKEIKAQLKHETKQSKQHKKEEKQRDKSERVHQHNIMEDEEEPIVQDTSSLTSNSKLIPIITPEQQEEEQNWPVLRILAGTRKKFRRVLTED